MGKSKTRLRPGIDRFHALRTKEIHMYLLSRQNDKVYILLGRVKTKQRIHRTNSDYYEGR
jgi:hypothetical protein